jgi:GH15 family glucan-1,4-alpha-glucosidase
MCSRSAGCEPASASVQRLDGYAPLRDYAAVGDGRTVALVARDGSIDWLPLPDLDSAAVFAGIVDRGRGGRFLLEPELPFSVSRRYLPDTNVLETSFFTEAGAIRVTDALTLPGGGLVPLRELQRRVDGLTGRVPVRWLLEPRFGYGGWPLRLTRRQGVAVASAGNDALALCSFEAGETAVDDAAISGRFETAAGSSALLTLSFAHGEPLVFPARDEVAGRLEGTCGSWRRWADARGYVGPWREAVVRSALALKLLVYAPSGAIAAAATTSLPEQLAGERNWDYRFSWVRDSAFTIDAFLQLGCRDEAQAYFWWLMHATQLTQPRLNVLYRLDGGTRARERELPLEGYRRSRPVRVGNGAAEQLQLDTYGELLQAVWLYAREGNRVDREFGRRVAGIADFVCDTWRQPDAGIWEVRGERAQYTQSKMMCAVALDRALQLARSGVIPGRHAARWRTEEQAIRKFVETSCWSGGKHSYIRSAGDDAPDAGLLLAFLHGYSDPTGERMQTTVDAVRRELGNGSLLRRYDRDDGLAGSEGCFVACSFWLVEALAHLGRIAAAAELMEQLLSLANDVGLYSEEIDAQTGEFLGNMPQALSHLALIGAATAIAEAQQ